MSYDRDKVQFNDTEHDAAEALDRAIEALQDGIQFTDVQDLLALQPVIDYLLVDTEGDKGLVGERFLTLGTMIIRDNDYLENIDDNEVPE